MTVKLRRIKSRSEVYLIAPCDVLPYQTGMVSAVEKGLYLIFKHGLPLETVVYVLGKNKDYWYRLATHLGRYE